MYKLRAIGKIKIEKENALIILEKKYHKALKYLDKFSHVHLFYTYRDNEEFCMRKKIVKLKEIDVNKGAILTHEKLNELEEAKIIDLKPYFPSEDSVKELTYIQSDVKGGIKITQTEDETAFEVNPIGRIRNVKGEVYIELDELEKNMGSHIIVYWWFHKFDDDKYRKATECNPPYENAPRTGIFATRSQVRPNPIAMTVVKIVKVDYERRRIYINGIESFDKTPCIGISRYSKDKDYVAESKVPEWLKHWPRWIENTEMQKKDTGEVICRDSGLKELIVRKEQLTLKPLSTGNEKSRKALDGLEIVVEGARENNLKGIDVRIPYGKITAVVGVSGSGKSSLVNDTIYAECRRRMEYLTNSRNLLQKPKVESMRGCIPAVIISQEAIRGNSLSTVGTYTNAYDYLRIIYASVATRYCPNCGNQIIPLSREYILNLLNNEREVEVYDLEKHQVAARTLEEKVDIALEKGNGAFYIKLPKKDFMLLQTKQKCYYCDKLMFEMTPQTFSYVDPDSRCPVCNGSGNIAEIDEKKLIEKPELSLLDGASSFYGKLRNFLENPNANWMKGQVVGLANSMNENLEKPWKELSIEFRDMLLHGSGEKTVTFAYNNKKNGRKGEIMRPVEGILPIIRRIYDENPNTKTLDKYMSKVTCKACDKERLSMEGRAAAIDHVRYPQAAAMTFNEVSQFIERLQTILSENAIKKIENAVISLNEIAEAAKSLGIGYLQLNQETSTLSGGEGQRVKLLGASINHMTGILYIFDEPSKGLHPKDYDKVIGMLMALKNEGNTIIIVEHNEDMINIADNIIEIGPGAGEFGGLVIGAGSLDQLINNKDTQLSRYINSQINIKKLYVGKNPEMFSFTEMDNLLYGNLKNIAIKFPNNAFTCICGVSGSGKSSLMKGEIYNRANEGGVFSEVVLVEQLPIGKTSKSIIATYIDIMDLIRIEFSLTEKAIKNKFNEKYFSFNGELGQCSTCKGEGKIKLKYMEDSYIICPDCKGKRYQKKILEVKYHQKNIDAILNMSIDTALLFWNELDEIILKLKALQKVGLGYLKLGQSTAALSGGEASRLKLAKELIDKKKNNILYLLDEPTTGLHFSDIDHLLKLIYKLVQNGNTVISIEHNRQFINNCDWLIELGPGAGKNGGEVVRQGHLYSDINFL